MTSSRPSRPNSTGKNAPPTSRRSARQQRLANREANRSLSRAGTSGSAGGGMGQILLWTVAAIAIGVVVIGGAALLTQKPGTMALQSPMAPAILTPSDIPTSGGTLGDANAKVTLDLYSDFQCPLCQEFALEMTPKLISDFVRAGKLKIAYHDLLVIDSNTGGTESLDAANAARCAADQGKFWLYHDWLFGNQHSEGSGAFTKDRLKTMGSLIGLNASQFDSCVDNGLHNAEIQSAQKAAPSGLSSTPGVYVNNVAVGSGLPTYDVLTAAINAVLTGASPSPSASASASATAAASATASASVAASASASPSATPAATATAS